MSRYVYRAYDRDGVLLYVGCAKSPEKRMVTHRQSSHWHCAMQRYEEEFFEEEAEAFRAETMAIKLEKPIFNHAHGRRDHRPVEYLLARAGATEPSRDVVVAVADEVDRTSIRDSERRGVPASHIRPISQWSSLAKLLPVNSVIVNLSSRKWSRDELFTISGRGIFAQNI